MPRRRNQRCLLICLLSLVAGCSDAGSDGATHGGVPDSGIVVGGGGAPPDGAAGAGGSSGTGGYSGTGASLGTGGTSGTGGRAFDAGAALDVGVPPVDAARATGMDGGAGGTPASSDASASALLIPAQGALLGSFVGTGTFDQLETLLGRKLAIQHDFYGWSDDYMVRVRSDLASGRVPLITWEAWTNGVGTPLDGIINGAEDALITARAQSAKAVGQKFFLRWGHEMNGNWYPWSGFQNGAAATANAKYIAAYRHIHDVFAAVGASNVLWVFCPNVDSVPADAWNAWTNYYPGDAYVDWMGFDGYNWGTSQAGSTWQSFTAIANRIYAGVAAKAKPIMIAETASAEVGGDKAAFIAGILPALKTLYPAVRALVWFDMNKETDWRVDSSPQAAASFVALANDGYMNP